MEEVKSCPRTVTPFWWCGARPATRAVVALCLLMLVDAGSPTRAQARMCQDEARNCLPPAGPVGGVDADVFTRLYAECERHVCIPAYQTQVSACPKLWLRSRLDEDYEACSRVAHEASKLCSRHCLYGARERATIPGQ